MRLVRDILGSTPDRIQSRIGHWEKGKERSTVSSAFGWLRECLGERQNNKQI